MNQSNYSTNKDTKGGRLRFPSLLRQLLLPSACRTNRTFWMPEQDLSSCTERRDDALLLLFPCWNMVMDVPHTRLLHQRADKGGLLFVFRDQTEGDKRIVLRKCMKLWMLLDLTSPYLFFFFLRFLFSANRVVLQFAKSLCTANWWNYDRRSFARDQVNEAVRGRPRKFPFDTIASECLQRRKCRRPVFSMLLQWYRQYDHFSV